MILEVSVFCNAVKRSPLLNPAARMVGAAAVAFLPRWGLNAALMRTYRAQSSRMGRTHARNVTCNHCLRQAMDMAGCR